MWGALRGRTTGGFGCHGESAIGLVGVVNGDPCNLSVGLAKVHTFFVPPLYSKLSASPSGRYFLARVLSVTRPRRGGQVVLCTFRHRDPADFWSVLVYFFPFECLLLSPKLTGQAIKTGGDNGDDVDGVVRTEDPGGGRRGVG